MLRRKPTAITLTSEDIAIYEDTRAREAHLQEQAAYQAAQEAAQAERIQKAYQQNNQAAYQHHTPNKNQNLRDPSDELRPLHGDRRGGHHVKTREERLGLVGGSSRG